MLGGTSQSQRSRAACFLAADAAAAAKLTESRMAAARRWGERGERAGVNVLETHSGDSVNARDAGKGATLAYFMLCVFYHHC